MIAADPIVVSQPVAQPARLLVVDGQPVVRLGLVALLAGQPDMVVIGEASTCAEACKLTATLAPDVMLLDLALRDASGCEALTRIHQARPDLPIIVLTAEESTRSVTEAVRHGVGGYLHKGVAREMICQAVRAVHAGRHFLDPTATRTVLAEVAVRQRRQPSGAALTDREREVLELLADGKRTRDISEILAISERAVKYRIGTLLSRLRASNRTQALRSALEQGLIARRDAQSNPVAFR